VAASWCIAGLVCFRLFRFVIISGEGHSGAKARLSDLSPSQYHVDSMQQGAQKLEYHDSFVFETISIILSLAMLHW
jgi:hypothetical protein